MELSEFRITNFRSVNDSGDIAVGDLTSLVGRNESGKSALLLALATLNPAGGRQPLSKIKDFPRGRRLEDCKPDTPVVESHWKLTADERAQLAKTLGYGDPITQVAIRRGYGPDAWVELRGVQEPPVNKAEAESNLQRLRQALASRIAELEEPHKANCRGAWDRFEAINFGDRKAWAAEAMQTATFLRTHLGAAAIVLDENHDALLARIEENARLIAGFDQAHANAHALVLGWLPRFVYVSEFPELYGHQNLDEYTQRRGQNPSMKDREDNFEKLTRVAEFDPAYLNENRDDHETRSQLLNRAGALVTSEIRRLWKDRPLTVRFNLDGPHLDVLVSDLNAAYPIEVNLDERSRGFRWFFAFYVTFSADTQGGHAKGAILLLDEPGLHLHAMSQEDLLKHLRSDYKNQIIYTTHSPFMVPPDAINIVRTVNIDPEHGTTVTDSPTGDSQTLFPLQAALGYHISQTLFVGHSNLVVEGVTDFWILSTVNAHFVANGTPALPDELTITPAGGAGKISYMAALLASQELKVLVLLDDDRAGREVYKDLVSSKLVRDTAIMFVTEGFSNPKPTEADIEDLIEPAVYGNLVNRTYRTELARKRLALNPRIPRIVKRYEEAFRALGIEFHKTRPAREFMARMASDPASVLPASSSARFEAVLKTARERYERIVAADRPAFV